MDHEEGITFAGDIGCFHSIDIYNSEVVLARCLVTYTALLFAAADDQMSLCSPFRSRPYRQTFIDSNRLTRNTD